MVFSSLYSYDFSDVFCSVCVCVRVSFTPLTRHVPGERSQRLRLVKRGKNTTQTRSALNAKSHLNTSKGVLKESNNRAVAKGKHVNSKHSVCATIFHRRPPVSFLQATHCTSRTSVSSTSATSGSCST